jgi:hypothetical protein
MQSKKLQCVNKIKCGRIKRAGEKVLATTEEENTEEGLTYKGNIMA